MEIGTFRQNVNRMNPESVHGTFDLADRNSEKVSEREHEKDAAGGRGFPAKL